MISHPELLVEQFGLSAPIDIESFLKKIRWVIEPLPSQEQNSDICTMVKDGTIFWNPRLLNSPMKKRFAFAFVTGQLNTSSGTTATSMDYSIMERPSEALVYAMTLLVPSSLLTQAIDHGHIKELRDVQRLFNVSEITAYNRLMHLLTQRQSAAA